MNTLFSHLSNFRSYSLTGLIFIALTFFGSIYYYASSSNAITIPLSKTADSNQPYALNLKGKLHSADMYFHYIRDYEDILEWEDIQKRTHDWQPVPSRGYHFGKVMEPIWLKITIRAPEGLSTDYRIRFLYPFIDHIEFYSPDHGLIRRTGLKHPLESRFQPDIRFVFPLHSHENAPRTYYFRVNTRTAFAPAAEIFPASISDMEMIKDHLPVIFYGALALSLFIYNLFIFYSLRIPAHLYYSLFIVAFSAYQFFIHGYGYITISDSHGFNQSMVHTLFQFAVFFHVGYALDVISLKDHRPTLYHWMMRARYLAFPGVLFYFAGFYYLEKLTVNLTNGILFIILLGIGLDSLRKGRAMERVYLLGWFIFIGGVISFISLAMGWIPFTREAIWMIHFSNSAELLALAWVLSYRLKIYRSHAELPDSNPSDVTTTAQKRSYLTGFSPEDIQTKLEHLFESEALFTQENLRLETLARTLGINRYQLSAFFNEYLGISYSEYLNQWRCRHAERLIREQPEKSIERIGYESGFSSKSNFYDAFRKIYAMPPGHYRKNIK